jgi:hypothetical protein
LPKRTRAVERAIKRYILGPQSDIVEVSALPVCIFGRRRAFGPAAIDHLDDSAGTPLSGGTKYALKLPAAR